MCEFCGDDCAYCDEVKGCKKCFDGSPATLKLSNSATKPSDEFMVCETNHSIEINKGIVLT